MTSPLIDTCRQVLVDRQYQTVDGMLLDAQTANAIVTVHDNLNATNRAKFLARPTPQVAHLAWSILERQAEREAS